MRRGRKIVSLAGCLLVLVACGGAAAGRKLYRTERTATKTPAEVEADWRACVGTPATVIAPWPAVAAVQIQRDNARAKCMEEKGYRWGPLPPQPVKP